MHTQCFYEVKTQLLLTFIDRTEMQNDQFHGIKIFFFALWGFHLFFTSVRNHHSSDRSFAAVSFLQQKSVYKIKQSDPVGYIE